MKVGAVVQARSASTRLPRKVLKELPYKGGITVLEQVLRRLQHAQVLDEIVVATTEVDEDGALVELAHRCGTRTFRSKHDVLERFYQAAAAHQLDVIVRITADCPCLDPAVVDQVVGRHLKTRADFTSNCLTRSYVHGLDTEVLSFAALETAHRQATQEYERQHVCPYIYKTRPDLFKIAEVTAPAELYAPEIRATLDTQEDYALLCAVFEELDHPDRPFRAAQLVELFRKKPWLRLINAHVVQKKVLATLEEEVEESLHLMQVQDLNRARDFVRLCWAEATAPLGEEQGSNRSGTNLRVAGASRAAG